jgi:hypothetical protein
MAARTDRPLRHDDTLPQFRTDEKSLPIRDLNAKDVWFLGWSKTVGGGCAGVSESQECIGLCWGSGGLENRRVDKWGHGDVVGDGRYAGGSHRKVRPMANINSKNEARKKVREARARVNEARQVRERLNVDDAASFLVESGRLAAVDEWEQGRVAEIHVEAERRRHEHRQEGTAEVSRMLGRGETAAASAELAGVKVSEVRAMLKSAGVSPTSLSDPHFSTRAAEAITPRWAGWHPNLGSPC